MLPEIQVVELVEEEEDRLRLLEWAFALGEAPDEAVERERHRGIEAPEKSTERAVAPRPAPVAGGGGTGAPQQAILLASDDRAEEPLQPLTIGMLGERAPARPARHRDPLLRVREIVGGEVAHLGDRPRDRELLRIEER